jgi:hypothetical protein
MTIKEEYEAEEKVGGELSTGMGMKHRGERNG